MNEEPVRTVVTAARDYIHTRLLEAGLPDPALGIILGSGLGDIATLQVPYKANVRFPYPGMYSFEIEQGMRTEELNHLFDIGLRIERMK